MTGPEHYQVAESLAEQASDYEDTPTTHHIHQGQLAQAHALLALAAATAFNCDCVAGEWPGWMEVAASDLTKEDKL